MKKLISLILVLVLGLLVVGYGAAADDSAVSTLNFNLGEFISITITNGDTVSFGTNLDPTVDVTMDDATTLAIETNIVGGWTLSGSIVVSSKPYDAVEDTVIINALDWGFNSNGSKVYSSSGSESLPIGYELRPTVDLPPGDYVMTLTVTVTID